MIAMGGLFRSDLDRNRSQGRNGNAIAFLDGLGLFFVSDALGIVGSTEA
jgi:hypothetical protein